MGTKSKKEESPLKLKIITEITAEIQKNDISLTKLAQMCSMDRSTVSDALLYKRASLEKVIEIASVILDVDVVISPKKK